MMLTWNKVEHAIDNEPEHLKTLVIGYGNTLRSDDGVGYRIAEVVMTWKLNGVNAIACHQLTPDLAADMAFAQQVIFVDAAIASSHTSNITLESLTPENQAAFTTHTATPSALLALTQWLYDAMPIAYQITIPAINLELGETLSPSTTAGQEQALQQIHYLCQDVSIQ